MINHNNELYLQLQFSLNRDREFEESDKYEGFLEGILSKKEYQEVDTYYICSAKAENFIKFINNKAIIIWDFNYWKYFKEYLIQTENCKKNGSNITQCITCVFTDFLSKKYQNIKEISSFLKQIKDNFGEDVNLPSEKYRKIDGVLLVCKCFAFFHELGHLEYKKNSNEKIIACKEIVLDFLEPLKEENFQELGYWMNLCWETVLAIRDGQLESVLEEMVADVFGIVSTVNYFFASNKNNSIKKICDIIIAIENLSTFQTLFNAINKAWDSHYTEMKFKLKPKSKQPDQCVNRLALARGGLDGLMLVVVVCKILGLEKSDVEVLWECRDNNHIDTQSIIDCLADDEFICTAIQEAMN